MASTKLRAGVIGLGVGKSHPQGYASSPLVELVALCDADTTRLSEMGQTYHVPEANLYHDYQKMLTEAKLDIVSVCLPNYLHAEVSTAALNAGVHVLCEKPMAPTV